MTSNSPNASHTVIDGDHNIVFKALPSGSIYHEKLEKLFIVSGATFEVKALLAEMEILGIPREKVRISPRAGITTDIDAAYERGECDLDGKPYLDEFGEPLRQAGTLKTGTTASGSGAVLAKKVLRHKTLKLAKDCPEIADMIGIVEEEILTMLAAGKSGLFEIGQGFPLSNNYWRFAPNTTSRNVTVSSALNDAFLPPSVVGNVIINTRTFPIRINSKKYVSVAQDLEIKRMPEVAEVLYNTHGIGLTASENMIKDMMKEKFGEFYLGITTIGAETTNPKHIVKLKAGKFLTWEEVQSGLFEYEVMDSYSGDWYPDQAEITWEDIEAGANIQIPQVVKNTTLTKLPRRVATFSQINLDEAIKYNQTNYFVYISVNFINFVDGTMEGVKASTSDGQPNEALSDKAAAWLTENVLPVVQKYNNATLAFIGTSEKTDDFIG